MPYKLFTLSAGVFQIDPKRFLVASFIGRAGRFFLIGTLIYLYGETIRRHLIEYLDVLTIALAVPIAAGFLERLLRR